MREIGDSASLDLWSSCSDSENQPPYSLAPAPCMEKNAGSLAFFSIMNRSVWGWPHFWNSLDTTLLCSFHYVDHGTLGPGKGIGNHIPLFPNGHNWELDPPGQAQLTLSCKASLERDHKIIPPWWLIYATKVVLFEWNSPAVPSTWLWKCFMEKYLPGVPDVDVSVWYPWGHRPKHIWSPRWVPQPVWEVSCCDDQFRRLGAGRVAPGESWIWWSITSVPLGPPGKAGYDQIWPS